MHVSFDENGDSKGRYNIMNFRRNRATRRYEYVTIGRWADELHMDASINHGINRITWAGGLRLTEQRAVCLSLCLARSIIMPKRLNISPKFFHRLITLSV